MEKATMEKIFKVQFFKGTRLNKQDYGNQTEADELRSKEPNLSHKARSIWGMEGAPPLSKCCHLTCL